MLVSMTIPALTVQLTTVMADKVARALNLLGADRDLLNTDDRDHLFALIDEYLDDPDDTQGESPPFNLLTPLTACMQ